MAAALKVIAFWLVAALALFLHALAGIPGDYLGTGYPVTPSLKVTLVSLAIDAALATLPILAAAGLARWLHLRWLALPVLVLLWLWAAAGLIYPFMIDFGTTWTMTEALVELALHPVHTPLALAAVLVSALVLLRVPPDRT
jgi:hypothetical protein